MGIERSDGDTDCAELESLAPVGPPAICAVVAEAIRAHGPRAVSHALGLSRQCVLAIGGGFEVYPSTLFVAKARMDRLRQLDEIKARKAAAPANDIAKP